MGGDRWRLCVPGCANNGSTCPKHGRQERRHQRRREYHDRIGTSASRGYSSRWQDYRKWWIGELHRLEVDRAGLCGSRLPGARLTNDSDCAAHGLIVPGRVVDHIVPVRGPDDPLFFDEKNLQFLCDGTNGGRGCHDRKRQREATTRPEGIRVVVTGPPGSGKSTWARQQASPGDLVWDLDDVASVMGFNRQPLSRDIKGNLPFAVMKAVLVMRDALVTWLAQTKLSARVYVIVTDPEQAAQMASRIGATVHTMTGGTC